MSDSTDNSLQSILDNLFTAIIVVNKKLSIECMNPSAEMLFDFSSNRAISRKINSIIINEHEFYDRLERTLVSNHPFSVYEAELQIHNNQLINVDYSVSPLAYKASGHFLLLEFSRPKYLLKHTQEEALLSQQDASRSLLRGLAHEIKNPLGGLRGAAQLLERQLDEKDHAFTQIIINEADRLKNLVDRMVGPKNLPEITEINIHKILEHVRQLVQAEQDEGNEQSAITIRTDYDPSIPDIQADESMLIQAILNITRNAMLAINSSRQEEDHALPHGEITFKTRTCLNCLIGTRRHPLVARIDITDNGCGVADNIKETLFLPMVTGRAEGTGLGLSIAQSLIQQHQGLIEFDSQPGKTVFTLLLPIHSEVAHKHDQP